MELNQSLVCKSNLEILESSNRQVLIVELRRRSCRVGRSLLQWRCWRLNSIIQNLESLEANSLRNFWNFTSSWIGFWDSLRLSIFPRSELTARWINHGLNDWITFDCSINEYQYKTLNEKCTLFVIYSLSLSTLQILSDNFNIYEIRWCYKTCSEKNVLTRPLSYKIEIKWNIQAIKVFNDL